MNSAKSNLRGGAVAFVFTLVCLALYVWVPRVPDAWVLGAGGFLMATTLYMVAPVQMSDFLGQARETINDVRDDGDG